MPDSVRDIQCVYVKTVHMKHITTLVLLGIVMWSSAQTPYRPFPESNAGWVEEHSWLNGFHEWTTCMRTVRFAADTVIGSVNYHQLRSIGNCSWFNIFNSMSHGYYAEADAVFARFRQDTVARKVFVYDVQQEQEVLWFDFTLGLGAYPTTFHTEFSDPGIVVVALDSMELNDGYHRTWVLATESNGNMQDSAFCTIIEGVGSTYGLHPVYGLEPPFEWMDALSCHSASGDSIYPLGGTACYLSMSLPTHTPRSVELVAYPNPASESVGIKGTLPTGARYVVVDPLGVEVRSGTMRSAGIELNGLVAGVYTVYIKGVAGDRLGAVRFVKE